MRLLAIRLLALSAALLTIGTAFGQTARTWSGGTGIGTAWATTTNWSGSVIAGSTANTNDDIAQFTNAGTGTAIGLDFGNLNTPFYLGTIQFSSTNTLSRSLGSSASTAGTLVLNGAGANNSILDNRSAGSMSVVTQASGSGGPMTLLLGNATINNINIGSSGNVVVGAVITGTSRNLGVTGIGSGRVDITNAANTFAGDIRITSAEARFSSNGSLGNANNSVVIDGGRFASAAGFTLAATHKLFVGDTAGTAISTTTSGPPLIYNGVIADVTGKTGSWVKQGVGTLALGGVSTYSGSTAIREGILQLTAGNNRLPTGTVVNLGQAAGPLIGTFDLNGQSQTIAGLNSITGTNSNAGDKNTVTNAGGTAATLTLGGSGTYSYGNGTNENSGVITGSINVVKSGSGTQTFGDSNTYVGITSVNGGTLLVTNAGGTGNGEVNVNNTGTLGGNGAIYGTLFANAGGTLRGDSGTGTGTLTLASTTLFGGSGATGANLATQLAVNGSGAITANSQVAVSTNTFNVDLVAGKFNVKLLNDLGLTQNARYTITLVTGAGGSGNFLRNGSAATGGNAFTASDFNLISGSGAWTFSGVSLTVDGSNYLVLQFTPVPEPATVLAVGAAGLGLAGWVRRRRAATVTA